MINKMEYSTVKTIICPNCGASASNFHNCEYCGSFLVQKASEGVDLSAYKNIAVSYSNPALLSAIKNFIGKAKCATENLTLFIMDASSRKTLVSLGINKYDDIAKSWGVEGIHIALTFFDEDATTASMLNDRFINSNLHQIAKMYSIYEGEAPNENKADEIQYYFDFGYDAEGACQVVLQLIDQVYCSDNQNIITDINSDTELMENLQQNNEGNISNILRSIPKKWLIIGSIILIVILILL